MRPPANDLDRLHAQLRRVARSYLRRERCGHTLQATALVHEALMRLLQQDAIDWNDTDHVQAIAAQAMRRILVDSARRHRALKRGGASARIDSESLDYWSADRSLTGDRGDRGDRLRGIDVLALEEALEQLADLDPQLARIVELRFYGECSLDQIARQLDMARRSVDRSWATARAWLYRAVHADGR